MANKFLKTVGKILNPFTPFNELDKLGTVGKILNPLTPVNLWNDNFANMGKTSNTKSDSKIDMSDVGKQIEKAVDNLTDSKIWKDLTGLTANESNLKFQEEKLAYDQQLQQQVFDREDSSYQRTVSDMRSSGMNPLAMNGTNNAGSVVATTAPQSAAPDFSSILSILGLVTDSMFKKEELNETKKMNAHQRSMDMFGKINELKSLGIAQQNADTSAGQLSENARQFDITSKQNASLLEAQIENLNSISHGNWIKAGSDANFLERERESALRYQSTQTARTLVETSISDLELCIKQLDYEYLNSHDISTFSPDFIKTLASIKDIPDDSLDILVSKAESILKTMADNHSLDEDVNSVLNSVFQYLGLVGSNEDFREVSDANKFKTLHPVIFNIGCTTVSLMAKMFEKRGLDHDAAMRAANKALNNLTGTTGVEFFKDK